MSSLSSLFYLLYSQKEDHQIQLFAPLDFAFHSQTHNFLNSYKLELSIWKCKNLLKIVRIIVFLGMHSWFFSRQFEWIKKKILNCVFSKYFINSLAKFLDITYNNSQPEFIFMKENFYLFNMHYDVFSDDFFYSWLLWS